MDALTVQVATQAMVGAKVEAGLGIPSHPTSSRVIPLRLQLMSLGTRNGLSKSEPWHVLGVLGVPLIDTSAAVFVAIFRSSHCVRLPKATLW